MTKAELQKAKDIINKKEQQPADGGETVLPLVQQGPPPTLMAQNVPGNIDLSQRPSVKNPDGTTSTVRSMSFNEDGKEVLTPTVVGNRVVSDEDAIRNYHETGEHLGKFGTVDEANAAGDAIHRQQELRGVAGWPQPQMAPIQRELPTPQPSPVAAPSMAGMNPTPNDLLGGLKRVRPDMFQPPAQPTPASPGVNPAVAEIQSQLAPKPQQDPTLIDRLKSALEYSARYGGTNPQQAQLMEQNRVQQGADNEFRRKQDLGAQAKAIMDRDRQDTQDARQRGLDERQGQMQDLQAQNIQSEMDKRNQPAQPHFASSAQGIYSEGTGEITSPAAKPTKEPSHRTVERGGKNFIEYFDPMDPTKVTASVEEGPVRKPSEEVLDLRRQGAVDRIRGAYNAHPTVKRFQTVSSALEFTRGLNPNTTNPADDIGLLYAFAKAMDPESVVREGEYATVQKYSQSWADTFGFDAKRMFSNTAFLTPQARANMKATIESKAKPEYQLYKHTMEDYRKDIDRVIPGGGKEYIPDYGEAFGGDTVRMKAPDGSVKEVSPDQVEHYKQLGATVVQ